jgi:predicted nucleic acid-binding protein
MSPQERLASAARIFLDTAPVIYFLEANAIYFPAIEPVFRRLDEGSLLAVTSPVTLAECLIHPLRDGNMALADKFATLLIGGPSTVMMPIDAECGRAAAQLRASYKLTLTDAIQLAVASAAGCDLFVTNDADLIRVPHPSVVTLDQLLDSVAGSSGKP